MARLPAGTGGGQEERAAKVHTRVRAARSGSDANCIIDQEVAQVRGIGNATNPGSSPTARGNSLSTRPRP